MITSITLTVPQMRSQVRKTLSTDDCHDHRCRYVIRGSHPLLLVRTSRTDPHLIEQTRQAIQTAGGIVVMDPGGTQIATINLQTVKQPEQLTNALAAIRQLDRLQVLDLSNTPLTDNDLVALRDLSHLNSLHLNGTPITDRAMQHISHLGSLEGLHVADTQVSSAAANAFGKLRSLRQLDISGTKVGEDLAFLEQLPDLAWLVTRDTTLSQGSDFPTRETTEIASPDSRSRKYRIRRISGIASSSPDLTID